MRHAGWFTSTAVAVISGCGCARECVAAALTPYQQSCVAASVPLPPAFGEPKGNPWKFEGIVPAGLVFASAYPTSDVYVYAAAGPPAGVCVGLPRRDADGVIQLLGVICQATNQVQLAGEAKPALHACFWDNLDAGGTRITSKKITAFNPALFQGGDQLVENCTNCHRGDNAYIVIEHTPEAKADMNHVNANGTPYVPLGQAGWLNPTGPLTRKGGCIACHSIPGLPGQDPDQPKIESQYCNVVLSNFILKMYPNSLKYLMPPDQTTRTRKQDDDIATLRQDCAKLGVVF